MQAAVRESAHLLWYFMNCKEHYLVNWMMILHDDAASTLQFQVSADYRATGGISILKTNNEKRGKPMPGPCVFRKQNAQVDSRVSLTGREEILLSEAQLLVAPGRQPYLGLQSISRAGEKKGGSALRNSTGLMVKPNYCSVCGLGSESYLAQKKRVKVTSGDRKTAERVFCLWACVSFGSGP